MPEFDLLLEAEKRGILPPDKQAELDEARRRNLVPARIAATQIAGEQAISDAAHIKEHPYGFGHAVAQVPTLGFADEIEARVRRGDYRQNLADINRSKDIYQRTHPGANFGAEMVGNLATLAGTLGTGLALRAPRVASTALGRVAASVPQAARTPLLAAGSGAGYGAGTAKPGERLGGAE